MGTQLLPNGVNNNTTTADKEAELVARLRAWGIHYLTGENTAKNSMAPVANRANEVRFLRELAACPNSRVRDAIIGLVLLHPELAPALLDALQDESNEQQEQLATLTLAALYLQQLWHYQLTLAFGHTPTLPEQLFTSLWQKRALPAPAAYQGRWGLSALEKQEQRRSGLPLTFQGDWQNQVHHLLLQATACSHATTTISLQKDANQEESSSLPAPNASEKEQEYQITMSMRPNVDRPRIEQFLTELGRRFRQAGRIYLVGGAAMVHAGIRPGSSATTQDIDVDVASGDMYQAIGQIKQQLNINVEFASPGDFIPLPRNWQQLSRFAGRYGKIDVFYFDFYSIALSKIERGNARDLQDVALLLQQSTITLVELDHAVQEVAAQMGKGAYKRLDSQAFLARYQAMRPHLQS
jgi:hypothetical protein